VDTGIRRHDERASPESRSFGYPVLTYDRDACSTARK
jgi:hypothetical protein